MKEKFAGVKAYVQDKVEQTTNSVNAFVESQDTKAAVQWTKDAIITAKDEAVELGKRVKDSEMGKDAVTGAAIGAVVAVPIPIIGPIFGALVGAGAGMAFGLRSGTSKKQVEPDKKIASNQPDADIHKRLIDLDDLRQKGILSQEEFDVEKNKVLGR